MLINKKATRQSRGFFMPAEEICPPSLILFLSSFKLNEVFFCPDLRIIFVFTANNLYYSKLTAAKRTVTKGEIIWISISEKEANQ